jgi:beta-glucanase (GH16 family)
MASHSQTILGGLLVSWSVIFGGCVAIVPDSASNQPRVPEGLRWEPVTQLSDEFNGTALDTEKWQPLLPYWRGRPPSRFAPENVTVSNGTLELRSAPLVDTLAVVKDPQKDIWISAGCVSSRLPIASYGYYEVRMRASGLPMTSSFWLQGKYSEIDVAEQRGAPTKHVEDAFFMQSTVHFYFGTPQTRKSYSVKTKLSTRPNEKFYVYGVWWKDKRTVWFYLDGRKVGEATPAGDFLEPMYLIFDTEVWADQSGLPSIEMLNDSTRNSMKVDWVRAWRLVDVHQN